MDQTAQTIQVTCEGVGSISLDAVHELHHFKALTDQDYAKCRNSMTDPDIGFSFPISIWKDQDGTCFSVDGHMRIRCLRRMQEEGFTIPLLPYNLIHAPSKQKAAKKIVASDSKYGTPVEQDFVEFLQEYDITPEEIEPFMEIPGINSELWTGAETIEEDEPPAVDESTPPVSQLGELYQLGRHRLLCGDATKIEDVEKLMNGQKADMVFTDPPYGVNFERGKFVGREKAAQGERYAPILNDELKGEDLTQFITSALSNANTFSKSAAFYVWSPSLEEGYAILEGIKQADIKIQSQIIWRKTPFVIGRADYHWQHEVCWYGFKEGHQWYGGRDKHTVWDCPKPTSVDLHPTMKPIQLCITAISNSSKGEDIILDIFGGSGSTLIACEQTNRTCYMMELDPKYCDVIRKRYAKFIGKADSWQETTPVIVDNIPQVN